MYMFNHCHTMKRQIDPDWDLYNYYFIKLAYFYVDHIYMCIIFKLGKWLNSQYTQTLNVL